MINIPTPDTILHLAKHDLTVRACVDIWKHGKITWEQAMMAAVVSLSQQLQNAMRIAMQTPAPTFVPPWTPPMSAQPNVPEGVDVGKLMHILVNEVCSCGAAVSIDMEDHGDECRAIKIMQRVKGLQG